MIRQPAQQQGRVLPSRDINRENEAIRTASVRSAGWPSSRYDEKAQVRLSRRTGQRENPEFHGSGSGLTLDLQVDLNLDDPAATPRPGRLLKTGHAAALAVNKRPRLTISPSTGPGEVTSFVGRHDRVVLIGVRLAAVRQPQGDLLGQTRIAAAIIGNRSDGGVPGSKRTSKNSLQHVSSANGGDSCSRVCQASLALDRRRCVGIGANPSEAIAGTSIGKGEG